MTHMAEMDRQVSLADQLQDTDGPVVLINKFEVADTDVDQLLAAWAADGAFFKQQPGFISAPAPDRSLAREARTKAAPASSTDGTDSPSVYPDLPG